MLVASIEDKSCSAGKTKDHFQPLYIQEVEFGKRRQASLLELPLEASAAMRSPEVWRDRYKWSRGLRE
jgi:hypothetical protein